MYFFPPESVQSSHVQTVVSPGSLPAAQKREATTGRLVTASFRGGGVGLGEETWRQLMAHMFKGTCNQCP